MVKSADKSKGSEAKSRNTFAFMNTNLTLDPWAKDPRTKPSFKASKRYRDHLVFSDPENEKIQFLLPKDMDESLIRFPTALDVRVREVLIAQCQMNKFATTIDFASRKQLCEQLGMAYDSKLNERIEDSVIYLSKLRVRYDQWRLAKSKKITKTLRPAIKRFELHRRKVHVEFDEQWIHLYRDKGGFYHSVPLPFPATPAMQNMYLVAFSQIDPKKPLTFSVPDFRRRTGFDKTTHQAVKQVLSRLADYIWANRGGSLNFDVFYDEVKKKDMVKLTLTLPVKGLSGVNRIERVKLDEPIYYRDVIDRLGIERKMWRFVRNDPRFPKEVKPEEWALLDVLKYRDTWLYKRLDDYEDWLLQ